MYAWLQASAPDKRPSGQRRALDAVVHLVAHFSGRALRSLGAADIRGYIDRRRAEGDAPATINRELAVFSSALNYARREWEWDVPNPVAGRRLREPEGRLRWLTRVEADRLIAAAEAGDPQSAGHLPDLIRLALHTGMRKGELLGLEWSRIDLGARLAWLEGERTKTGRRRSVPLNNAARGVLARRAEFRARHCPDSPWVWCHADGSRLTDPKRSFASALKAAGIADFRFHDLRHTCASWLVSAGVPLPEVASLLGHSTVRMAERYAHLAPERVRAAVEILDMGESARPELRVAGREA